MQAGKTAKKYVPVHYRNSVCTITSDKNVALVTRPRAKRKCYHLTHKWQMLLFDADSKHRAIFEESNIHIARSHATVDRQMFQARCCLGLIVNFLNLCLLSPELICAESTSVSKAKLRATSSTSGKSDFLSPKTNLLPVDALCCNVTEILQWNLFCLKLWCKLSYRYYR